MIKLMKKKPTAEWNSCKQSQGDVLDTLLNESRIDPIRKALARNLRQILTHLATNLAYSLIILQMCERNGHNLTRFLTAYCCWHLGFGLNLYSVHMRRYTCNRVNFKPVPVPQTTPLKCWHGMAAADMTEL